MQMHRARWMAIAILLGACYEVSELRGVKPDAASGSGGGAGSGGVSGAGFPGGSGGSSGVAGGGSAGSAGSGSSAGGGGNAGTGASTGDASMDASDAAKDAADAKADVADGGPVGTVWRSCMSLHYGGECIGSNTVMYYDEPASCNIDGIDYVCYVSRCSLLSGSYCKEDPTCGWDCDPKLAAAQVQNCATELVGKCVDNVAIKADSVYANNCLFKDCKKLSAQCVVKSNGPDCY